MGCTLWDINCAYPDKQGADNDGDYDLKVLSRCVHVQTRACMHTYKRSHTHTHKHTHRHIHTQTHTYIHTHTQMRARRHTHIKILVELLFFSSQVIVIVGKSCLCFCVFVSLCVSVFVCPFLCLGFCVFVCPFLCLCFSVPFCVCYICINQASFTSLRNLYQHPGTRSVLDYSRR